MDDAVVAAAYADFERATGRLVLIVRLAELLRQTPDEMLPTVCYLCQGTDRHRGPAADPGRGPADQLAGGAVLLRHL